MNLRCTYCQTPFTVGRLEKLAAIQRLQAENLHHYDVFCPRCRRANSVSRQRLEIFTPGWQEGLRTLEAEASKIETGRPESAPAPQATISAPASSEPTRNRHTPRPVVAAPARAESTPSLKGKPAAPKGKTPSKAAPAPKSKPAAKKTPSKAVPASKSKPAAKKTPSKAASSPKAKKPAAKATSSPKGKPAAKAKKPAAKKK